MLRRRAQDVSRTSTSKHGALYRLAAWTRASRAFRATPEGALCYDCRARGKPVPSEVVDHVRPHNGDMQLFWDRSNWAPRCWSCHSSKSLADRYGTPRRGCDASGMPLDPNHPWNRG